MKIIFVGMHNKAGKMPLCSSTQTGKTIDQIIIWLRPAECIKTNLCDCDYLPGPDELDGYVRNYMERVEYKSGDAFVLLGKFVQDNFPKLSDCKIIALTHPAAIGNISHRSTYVNRSLSKIVQETRKK